MRWYQRLSTKLAATVVIVIGIILVAAGVLVTRFTYSRLKRDAEVERREKTDSFRHDLETINALMQDQVKAAMRVLRIEAQQIGEPALGATVNVGGKNVPNLLLGNVAQANNFAVVDKVKEIMGGTATLFVKSGDDFVRVSTNLQKEDGSRAIGTVLDPKGKAMAAIKTGKPFYGVVGILDRPYITGYEPLQNKSGEIIGVWYVGYPIQAVEQIQEKITNTKILENGFLALVDDNGGIVIKPSNTTKEDVNEAIQAATAAKTDGWNVEQVNFEPWNYKIVSAYSDSDPQLVGQINNSIRNIIGGDIFVLTLLAALIFFLTQWFMRPLNEVVRVANGIAQGRLEGAVAVRSNDEIGQVSYSMNKVVNYLQEMSGVADQISEGNLQVEISPRSDQDRFGTAFQNMLERTLRLVQTQDERNRLQRSIMKLLEEVADVGDGDLTAEAEVTADATGAIADAFNYMIVELRNIIGRVKVTSAQVDTSAAKVQSNTEMMVRRSEQQSSQLNTLSTALEEMATAMQKVAQETTSSARVSDNAFSNAKQGTTVIGNNIAAMNRLRSRIQETSERIKRLGERSQEISSIVKIINDLAQRTSVLALNASIQATAAGQAGRGFVAVAEEVERLAERSATASKQIDALTKAIQGETEEAVISMETTVKEVAVGVKLTGEVGETLGVIELVTKQLAEISQSIAVAARHQAQTSADISDTMRNVATSSQQSATGMKESAATVNQLAVWTQDLRGSVASFKLPEADEPTPLPTAPSSNGVAATVSY